MNYNFPQKVMGSQKSLIRDIAEKGKMIPGFISFALGNPATEGIPEQLLIDCAAEVFAEDPMGVFQYGPMVGDAALRDWVQERVVTTKGCPREDHTVILLTGSGKALSLVPRTLCAEGDEMFCDAYTFPNAYNSVRNIGAIPVGISMDEYGMLPDALEEAARSGKGKYIYLIPNFQNPTGMTMPEERRKAIYAIAQRYDLLIYEDDPYGEIRFAGEPVPTFKSMDTDGRVMYVGSFSKTLSAGLRVGFLYAHKDLAAKISSVKSADGQDPLYNQRIVRKALERMDYDQHLVEISAIYGRKCRLMVDGLREHCADGCRIYEPEGGMFVWVSMPAYMNVDAVSDAALQAGVGVVKSAAFAVDQERPGRAFRLNFSAATDEDIVAGVKRLGEITQRFRK